jgi:hypothetical protein
MRMKAEASPYRRISKRIWSDSRFTRLSPLPASGQSLFLVLLVGPQTSNIPGVMTVGRAALAEQLGWEPGEFDAAWSEIQAEQMAEADWRARLIWLPRAVHHNAPQSPNVVRSWASTWAQITECDLKWRIWEAIHAELLERGIEWADEFADCCPRSAEDAKKPRPPRPKRRSPRKKDAVPVAAAPAPAVVAPDEPPAPAEAPAAGTNSVIPGLEDEGDEPEADGKAKTKRATRLADDWALPRAWGEWTKQQYPSVTVEEIRHEAALFKDHWTALSGRAAVKSKWDATWRNWCRRVDWRRTRNQVRSQAPADGDGVDDLVQRAMRVGTGHDEVIDA